MDGLIIDSEPLWRQAEIKVFNSIGLDFTEDMCRKTMGMRIDEVVRHWKSIYNFSDNNQEIENNIVEELIFLINKKGSSLPGILEVISLLNESKINLAIASSSNMKIISTVVKKLDIEDYFSIIHSAEFEKYGKPHPQVFLSTAEKLHVSPENCLVFEDSKHGMIAALAAKMKLILIPENPLNDESWFHLADYKLNSMLDFDLSMLRN